MAHKHVTMNTSSSPDPGQDLQAQAEALAEKLVAAPSALRQITVGYVDIGGDRQLEITTNDEVLKALQSQAFSTFSIKIQGGIVKVALEDGKEWSMTL